MSETFGFLPDEDGNISFMTVQTEFIVHNLEEWGELFAKLVELSYQNSGVMPILTFPDYEKP